MLQNKRMNIKQLQYFLGVLKERSITKAAARLYVAQPALGLQMRKLEKELNVDLFVRHSRGVTPTEAGIRLAGHAEILIRQFDRAKQDMLDYAGEPQGRVIVGLTTSTSFVVAGILAERCQQEYPKLSINITVGLSEGLMEAVQDDRIDLTLTYNPDLTSGLVCQPLAKERLYFVQNTKRGKISDKNTTFTKVLENDLILPSHPHLVRVLVDTTAQELNLEPIVKFEVDSVPAKKELIRHDLACSIMPYAAVHAEVTAGEFQAKPVKEPALERTLYIAHSQRRPSSKAFMAVRSLLSEVVRSLAENHQAGWTLYESAKKRNQPQQIRSTHVP